MQQMTTVEAIKAFFSTESRPIVTKEVMELRKSMEKDAWDQFGRDVCKAMNVEWKASA